MRFARYIVPALLFLVVPTSMRAAQPLRIALARSFGEDFEEVVEHMEARFHVEFLPVYATAKGKGGSPENASRVENLDDLHRADVILSNFYRTWIPAEHMEGVKKAFRTKPVVGTRKAHHGFQNWLEADMEVFGVDYRGHCKGGDHRIAKGRVDNPIVSGFDPIEPDGGYYGHQDFAPDVVPLLVMTPGGKGNEDEASTQTWHRVNAKTGQRVVYTRYGPQSLKHDGVRDLVVRSLFWAADKDEKDYRK